MTVAAVVGGLVLLLGLGFWLGLRVPAWLARRDRDEERRARGARHQREARVRGA